MRSPRDTALACPPVRVIRTGTVTSRSSVLINEVSEPVELAVAALVSVARLLAHEGCPLREQQLLDDRHFRRLESLVFSLPAAPRADGAA